VAAGRRALVVATYEYADGGLRRLTAPEHDADSFAEVLKNPAIAGFDVTMLVNQPHYVVGEAIADFYTGAGRDDLTLLYFTGHGVKDDEGRLYLAMTNTRREALMFTAISGAQLNDAMDSSRSRRKILILDCCYSGAFPAGRTAKSDEGVHTLERFQGRGRAVLTASDATQYAFEGDDVRGTGTSSVFTGTWSRRSAAEPRTSTRTATSRSMSSTATCTTMWSPRCPSNGRRSRRTSTGGS
jgi:uncharacterized caspase-like protein